MAGFHPEALDRAWLRAYSREIEIGYSVGHAGGWLDRVMIYSAPTWIPKPFAWIHGGSRLLGDR